MKRKLKERLPVTSYIKKLTFSNIPSGLARIKIFNLHRKSLRNAQRSIPPSVKDPVSGTQHLYISDFLLKDEL